MTTTKSQLLPLSITPGVQPNTDKTAFATPHYTMADKIRFRFGFPQKLGGWYSILLAGGASIAGIARSIFSVIISTSINTVIGTNSNLYSLSGSTLTNITPLKTGTTAIANSLATDFIPSDDGEFNTDITQGSNVLGLEPITAQYYQPGDIVSLSGASSFGHGFTDAQINTTHTIFQYGSTPFSDGIYAIHLSNNATSSGTVSNLGAATGRIRVTATAHGLSNGTRVKIAGAVDTGGITALQINNEFVIRNVTTDTFDIFTTGIATSAVTGGGGAGVTFQSQIDAGNINQFIGQGYGMGKYGVGLYGTALMSTSTLSYPRIWFFDRFGNNLIMTAGNQTGVYTWAANLATAPTLITNAPAAVNYAFVSDNILVTFGAGGTVNRIFASDQANITQWTSSSSNQVFDYTVVGAGRLVSHVPVNSVNLIFTNYQTYLFQYTGFTAGIANGVWHVELLENNIGIIAPMARCSVGGTAYWMAQNNFYMWSGGNITVIPSNSQEESTILNYVFKNINRGQLSKCFAWFNEQFSEVWFHYPSAGSNEPDRVARLNIEDYSWVPDTFDRLCAEYPNLTLGYPRLINSNSILYAHEQGVDNDGIAMAWSLSSNLRGGTDLAKRVYGVASRNNNLITGFVPDSIQTGNINVEIVSQRYPQSSVSMYDNNFTVTPTTEFESTEIGGRFWMYNLSGETLGQYWQAGQWMEYVAESSPQ